jgi:hypothetical protein
VREGFIVGKRGILELLGCGGLFFEIGGCDREEFKGLEGSSIVAWGSWSTLFHHCHPIMVVRCHHGLLHLHHLMRDIHLPCVIHHLC